MVHAFTRGSCSWNIAGSNMSTPYMRRTHVLVFRCLESEQAFYGQCGRYSARQLASGLPTLLRYDHATLN